MSSILLSLALIAAPLEPAHPDQPTEPASEEAIASNPEMTAMFELDQSMRTSKEPMDWEKVAAQDEAHRVRTRELLEAGELRSGEDFFHAAFIFQHGGEPEDYLLAHVMATTAMKLGYPFAEWIAAASLDRFLMSIERPQVFGTQYQGRTQTPDGEFVYTMGEYDEDMLTDQVRQHHRVPVLSDQKAKLETMGK